MSVRSRSREVALQILCEDEANSRETVADLQSFLNGRLNNPDAEEFAQSLILGVRRNRAEIDAAIEAIAANWTLTRMAITDRNALRLGTYEVLFGEAPRAVAINEAVELAKRFGGANSAGFVNGILDKLKK